MLELRRRDAFLAGEQLAACTPAKGPRPSTLPLLCPDEGTVLWWRAS